MSRHPIGEYLLVEKLQREANRKTDQWKVYGLHDNLLGLIKWFGRWRQYTFFPAAGTVFNSTCLLDLKMHLDWVNKEWREAKRNG